MDDMFRNTEEASDARFNVPYTKPKPGFVAQPIPTLDYPTSLRYENQTMGYAWSAGPKGSHDFSMMSKLDLRVMAAHLATALDEVNHELMNRGGL